MLEQQEVSEMDREQYYRVMTEDWDQKINKRIDEWHVSPYIDEVPELFQSLKLCTEAYVTNSQLDHHNVINIVKDLRDYLNPHGDKHLFHFTDMIADAILQRFTGIDENDIPAFNQYINECEARILS